MANFADVVMWGQGLEQQAQQNADRHQEVLSNLASAKLNQENTQLTIDQRKADLANEQAFKGMLLQNLATGEQKQQDLSSLAGQPSPYQQQQDKMTDVQGRLNSTLDMQRATQRAIDQYARIDPIYAQKQQALLNEQLKQGMALAKEQNELKIKQAAKLTDELYPVLNADNIAGKLDEGAYRALVQKHIEDGTPLAAMGLTGDLSRDKDRLKILYAQGISAKDQGAALHQRILEGEKQLADKVARESLEERMWKDRQDVNLRQQGLSIRAAKAAPKDPRIEGHKDLEKLDNEYRKDWAKLQDRFDKARSGYGMTPPNPELTEEIRGEMEDRTANYEKQKEASIGTYAVPTRSSSAPTRSAAAKPAAPVNKAAQEAAASGF